MKQKGNSSVAAHIGLTCKTKYTLKGNEIL